MVGKHEYLVHFLLIQDFAESVCRANEVLLNFLTEFIDFTNIHHEVYICRVLKYNYIIIICHNTTKASYRRMLKHHWVSMSELVLHDPPLHLKVP